MLNSGFHITAKGLTMNVNAQLEEASYNAVHSIMALWEAITYKTFMKLTTKKIFNVTATYNVFLVLSKKVSATCMAASTAADGQLKPPNDWMHSNHHVRARTRFATRSDSLHSNIHCNLLF
jgi:hypothetical protein